MGLVLDCALRKTNEDGAIQLKRDCVQVGDEWPVMKQMLFSKVLTVVACRLVLYSLVSTLAVADLVQYIHDDLDRLLQVIDGQGNGATYEYGAVGNLPSITRNLGGSGTSATMV